MSSWRGFISKDSLLWLEPRKVKGIRSSNPFAETLYGSPDAFLAPFGLHPPPISPPGPVVVLALQSVCACASHLPQLQRAAAAVGWPSLFTAPAWDTLRPCSCTAAVSPAPAPAPLKSLVCATVGSPAWSWILTEGTSLPFLFLPELGAYRCWGIRFIEQQGAGAACLAPRAHWSLFLPALPRRLPVTDWWGQWAVWGLLTEALLRCGV